jgi:hypothetical protein
MQLTPPKPETTIDPSFYGMQQQAIGDYQTALQQQLSGDTAAIMARYGSRLALSGSGGGPAIGVR